MKSELGMGRDEGRPGSVRILLWDYHVERSLVDELAREGYEVVATGIGRVAGVEQISLESFSAPGRVGAEPLDARFAIRGSDGEFRCYNRGISRVGDHPFRRSVFLELGGAVLADEVEPWMRVHTAEAVSILRRLRVHEVWFTSVPHFGLDEAVAMAARSIGATVLVTRQLPFPGKFLFEVQVQGRRLVPHVSGFKAWSRGATELDLFYMRPREAPGSWTARWQRALSIFRDLCVSPRERFLARIWFALSVRRLWKWAILLGHLDRYDSVRAPGIARRFRDWVRFRGRRRCLSSIPESPFVFFALHNEPEANADVYGGEYKFQPDALAALSAALPAGWRILVKENPAQSFVRRGEAFHRLIESLPDVWWVPDDTPSTVLVARAVLVASLCGTVGYEALLAGKPCLFFGHPWYEGLPGAFRFEPGIDLEEVARCRVDKAALDAAVNAMVGAAADGIVTRRFTALVPDGGESEAMTRLTARSLVRISRAARACWT